MNGDYSYTVDRSERYGPIVTLRYGELGQARYRAAAIAPGMGANLFRLVAGGADILSCDLEEMKLTGFSGSPILYPTPNRVRGCRFTFEGTSFQLIKHGSGRFMHGLLYDEAFQFSEPVIDDNGVRVTTWYDFQQGSEVYESFPFAHRLTVEYTLAPWGVRLRYQVRNDSGRRLPYGFAIHPFFHKLAGAKGTTVAVPADQVFEKSSPSLPPGQECLPTGRILGVKESGCDLRPGAALAALDLDDVFTGFPENTVKRATVGYQGLDWILSLEASEEFGKLVVYTPPQKTFFCLENQTCMTDAHNMYEQGLRDESGLIILEPGEEKSGFIRFCIDKTLGGGDGRQS